MTDRESAEAVVDQWNGKCYPNSDVPLQVRFADTPMQKSNLVSYNTDFQS